MKINPEIPAFVPSYICFWPITKVPNRKYLYFFSKNLIFSDLKVWPGSGSELKPMRVRIRIQKDGNWPNLQIKKPGFLPLKQAFVPSHVCFWPITKVPIFKYLYFFSKNLLFSDLKVWPGSGSASKPMRVRVRIQEDGNWLNLQKKNLVFCLSKRLLYRTFVCMTYFLL